MHIAYWRNTFQKFHETITFVIIIIIIIIIIMNKQITTNAWLNTSKNSTCKENILEHKKHKNEYRHISLKYKTWTSRLTLNSNYWITFY